MNIIKKHPLTCYFIIAYILTWLLVLPLVLTGLGLISVNMNWHFLGPLGPTISAIIVVYITKKKEGLKKLKESIIKWRVGAFWIFFSALIMPFFLILTILLNLAFTGNYIDLVAYLLNEGLLDPLSLIIWIWVGAISYGIFEEIGWRGYALPNYISSWLGFLACTNVFLPV